MVLSCLRLWMNRTLRPAAAKELRNLRSRRVLVNGSVQDFSTQGIPLETNEKQARNRKACLGRRQLLGG